ncbi:TetR/AcrR family transcriptional regulator [Oryzobacter telluris]|uniref:TetR/AcrR family transcriptional regulator n=1 Tax=Oryzobacter telluris TaxID=3149179 RepID=UPI00370DDEA1
MSRFRTYDNSARSRAAAETRRRILDTARELLLEGGYHAMSVAQLAAAARVSPQTVYNAVGGKGEVVKAVYDLLLAGDESPVPMSERPEFLAMAQAPDREGFGRAYAAFSASIHSRVGPLLGVLLAEGAGSDATLKEFVATIDRERLTGNTHAIGLLERSHGLPAGRAAADLVDEVWTLTAPEVFDRLVRRRGWSTGRYGAWLADALAAACTRTAEPERRGL